MPEKGNSDDNIVIFKGRQNGLIVDVCPDAPFERILAAAERKVKNASRFFGDEDTAVTFKGRTFTDSDLDKLLNVFREHSDLNITYSGEERGVRISPAPPAEPPAPSVKKVKIAEEQPPQTNGGVFGNTVFWNFSLRSGMKKDFDGNIIIWGDINPGAELIAAGHVIVLGALRGVVWAGCGGDPTATVTAIIMQPTQIRIAGEVRLFQSDTYVNARRAPRPMKAYIEQDGIHVVELV